MDEKFHTSQQKSGGGHHLAEGKKEGAITVDVGVTEGSTGRGTFTQTSQQARGEHDLPESKQ